MTLPAWALLFETADLLTITPAKFAEWRELADRQGIIIWNRQGEVRIVSNAVLDNALHIYAEYQTMIAGERLQEMPATANGITWAQTHGVKDYPCPVLV